MGRLGFMFDCDGTLMDTIGAWHEAERQMLDEVGTVLTKEERDELNALTLAEAGAFFHERFGICESPQAAMDKISSYLLAFYRTSSTANPGALDFVRAAVDAGAACCVLSSSPQEFLQAGLERGGFLPYIEHIISVEDLDTTKRDIATYHHVCDVLGTEPHDTWLLDDSWYALQTARDAGVRTIGFFSSDGCGTHEELAAHSERVVDSFSELSIEDFS